MSFLHSATLAAGSLFSSSTSLKSRNIYYFNPLQAVLDLTLLVVVVVVVISGGTAMFFYTSFQKGLIIFYSLEQDFFCLTRFTWSSGQWWIRRKSQRWLSSWCELIPSRRLGRYIMFTTTQETAPIALFCGSLESFHFACILEYIWDSI